MKDTELLQFIHETAAMGELGLEDILGRISGAGLKRAVESQRTEYQRIAQESAKLLQARGQDPKDPSLMARLSSQVMSMVQTLAEPSDSKIAELVIKGNNMGVTKGLKHLHDYTGGDPKIRALAERLLSIEQANAEQMKPFL